MHFVISLKGLAHTLVVIYKLPLLLQEESIIKIS